MAKVKRGLPDGFSLGVNVDSPAILGDFLDEAAKPALPVEQSISKPREPPAELSPRQKPEVSLEGNAALRLEPLEVAQPEPSAPAVEERKIIPLNRSAYVKPPRFELSLNHETKRMVQELLSYIQTMGPQPPAKASEMFQGIISVLYRAKGFLDLSSVPRRGQWGSPTAKAFPIALGEAFAKAIAEQQRLETSKPRR